ncbi:2-polyprenyl-6-methoxyphenol hydroxylase-like FAD-dependent oxidoreductase [Bradyrhizobium elkanii]|uniref:2-polyprenyl-6-methoxyphenol hydroxylase n=1 Tax=Bradyrhizobium japonicum TaxID=375 RepID=A0A1L3FCW7_BRAJP|nr:MULTISPECIES: NAD(P)/FAD-dependent oxidoreductase [Bradyrhizobium]APG11149.1 2-polyprenyl-6-methoxyphenol hydroxylase [Bradyrhizobium japonicum]MCS3929087.1 2-polyprenyl-6-methoxyphenol hydroxylase-like FAD-dependent oxidoreductase [Bradyrhizobium elkanii]MCS3969643.1 2-polyprenyl-6-methoxyphenol hydroxylase-like FAD-dependent oxidoreductase [Bradyrhizobium japonicum]
MRYTDIAIIGGGLSGSTAAAMLGRAGISTVLIDPHASYPADFRVEKLSGQVQVERFLKTGIGESVLRRATFAGENWIARFGRLLDKAPSRQFNILYDSLVNAVRDEIPAGVERICAKAVSLSTSPERQKITLSNEETISARLVVLANGLNVGLRHQLGIARKIISACHSISIGFDVVPAGRNSFDFPALTYFSERPSDRIPYITLFPTGPRMRANLFVYRGVDDPWLRELRRAPAETLNAALPRLKRITGAFDIAGEIKIRPVDLYVNDASGQPGLVLVGDAFSTSCPAAGTGCDKVFTDVERLCNVHIPEWLASDGMDGAKIATFYADPVKRACDEWSAAKAFEFRSVSTATSPYWTAQRWARFIAWSVQGLLRPLGGAIHLEPNFLGHASSSSSSSSSSSRSSSSSSSSSLSSSA